MTRSASEQSAMDRLCDMTILDGELSEDEWEVALRWWWKNRKDNAGTLGGFIFCVLGFCLHVLVNHVFGVSYWWLLASIPVLLMANVLVVEYWAGWYQSKGIRLPQGWLQKTRRSMAGGRSMHLRPCRHCNKIISIDAKTCPACGLRTPTQSQFERFVRGTVAFYAKSFLAVLVVGVILFATNPSEESFRKLESEKVGKIGGWLVDQSGVVEYKSYGLFSVVTISPPSEKPFHVYGALTQWLYNDAEH